MIVDNIIPRNMIINLGCASVDNHIPWDDIFDYHPLRECNIYIISLNYFLKHQLIFIHPSWVVYNSPVPPTSWLCPYFLVFLCLHAIELLKIYAPPVHIWEFRLTPSKGTHISFMNKAIQPYKCTCSYKRTLNTLTGPQIRVRNWKSFSYFSTKTYVVGTQKNRLNETVLLRTQNTCLNRWIRK